MRTDEVIPDGDLILGKTLRQHIGGRWAISLIAYLINAPLNLLAILGNIDSAPRASDALTWIGIAITGYLVLGAVVLIANYTVFRTRSLHPVPIWWVVALGAIAGGSRGIVVGVLAERTGLSEGGAGLIATRTVTGAILGAILIPAAALLLSSISAYVSRRQVLVHEQQLLHTERMRAEGVSEALRVALVESVRGDLSEVARTQDADLARSVSHRVWESGEELQPLTVRWGRVVGTAFIHNPYPTVPVSIIWVLSAWGGLTSTIGGLRATLQVTFTVVCIAAVFAIGRRLTASNLIARRTGPSLLVFLLSMLVLVTLTGPVTSIIFDPRPFAASAPLILINTIWLPALTIAVGVVVSAVRSSEEVLAALTDQVTDEEIAAAAAEQEEQRIRREVASRLHGSVQSRLLAAAGLMRQPGLLQQAGISDPALLLQDLADSVDHSMDVDERSLQERIAAITRPWSSLMAITLSITGEVDSRFATSIVRVIEETLTNAFRHGNATVVDISITEAVSAVDVTVTDNGSGPSPRLAQGLGSQILSTVGEWDMAALPTGGTCVRVTIPLTLD